jgi:hypothetical protein
VTVFEGIETPLHLTNRSSSTKSLEEIPASDGIALGWSVGILEIGRVIPEPRIDAFLATAWITVVGMSICQLNDLAISENLVAAPLPSIENGIAGILEYKVDFSYDERKANRKFNPNY